MEKRALHDLRIADMIRKAAEDTRQQEKRIAAIFGKPEIPQVTDETLAIYFDYLQQHLELTCRLTGWVSRYRSGSVPRSHNA